MTEVQKEIEKRRKELYRKYCKADNKYQLYNMDKIDYVMSNILAQQLRQKNPAELEATKILKDLGIENVKYQETIPILNSGGKLENLWLADIVVNDNVIVEIDGSYHDDPEKISRDIYRDEITKKAGYVTKRYLTTEMERLKNDFYDKQQS